MCVYVYACVYVRVCVCVGGVYVLFICLFDLTSVHPKVILDMNGLVGCDVMLVFVCLQVCMCSCM